MIRRVLAFVLLLALGFVVLKYAIGDDDMMQERPVAAGGTTTPADPQQPIQPAPQQPTGPQPGSTVRMQGPHGVGVQVHGELRLQPTREVRRPDGGIDVLPMYALECADSGPAGEGLQRLQKVRVKLFDGRTHAADLTADEAIVALGRDERGQVSVRQDKDVFLQQAELRSVADSGLPPFTATLPQARLRVLDHELQLLTPNDDDMVSLVIGGERPATLIGKGLQARLPRSEKEQLQRLDLTVLHDPVFTTGQVTVRARGRLGLVHDLADGTGLLTVDDAVELELSGARLRLSGGDGEAGRAAAGGPVLVRGDRLVAWLLHEREAGGAAQGGRTRWTRLDLDGAPARASGSDAELQAPRLSVLPDAFGEPVLITGWGGAGALTQTDGKGETRFTATRRIHLLRPGIAAANAARSLGFPLWSLGQVRRFETAVLEGGSTAALPDGTVVGAADGLRVDLPDGGDGVLVARGRGAVTIERPTTARGGIVQPPVRIAGNDGLRIERQGGSETLVLGPAGLADASGHRYHIEHGELHLRGQGTCRFARAADGRITATLRAGGPHIEADQGQGGGSVRGAERLDLVAQETDGQVTLLESSAGGPALTGELRRGAESLTATAARVTRPDPRTWDLRGGAGAPARLERLAGGPTRGPASLAAPFVRIHELGPRCAVLDARAEDGARAQLEATDERRGDQVKLTADRVRALPFAVPRQVLDAHLGGLGSSLGWLPGLDLGQPWLLAEGAVDADLTRTAPAAEPKGPAGPEHVRGNGELLLLATASGSGLLRGDPRGAVARLVRTEASGRWLQADSPQVLFDRTAGSRLRLLTAYPGEELRHEPVLLLRDPKRRGSDALADLQGRCAGEIEVLPDRVLFDGPVAAQALTAEGTPDPAGMRVTAEQLSMVRRPETGEVILIQGRRGVRLDWSRIQARATELTLDLRRSQCTVADPAGAEIWLPNGLTAITQKAVANYQNMSLNTWHSRVSQTGQGNGPDR